ncbi:MAG: SixA phosphatase family protein [Pyrinomonadaceae bacterium]
MKTLLLLRHAKSSWEKSDLADFDRPLNSRGLAAAPLAGNIIYDRHLQLDLILSSPAKRAKQTAVLVKETGQITVKIQYEEKIYEASPLSLLSILAEQSDKNESILLVGHNPGLEGLIKVLTGKTATVQTATLAKINLKIENWQGISPNCGELEFVARAEEETKKLSAE